jgi:hypothetical protein
MYPTTFPPGAPTEVNYYPRMEQKLLFSASVEYGTIPYAVGPATTTTTTNTYTVTTMVSGWANFTATTPPCSIPPSQCAFLKSSFTASSYAALETDCYYAYRPGPHCATESENLSKGGASCGKCTIVGDTVEVIYWPVPSTVSRDMCATAPTTSPPTFRIPSPVPVVQSNGTNFHADKVYLSFNSLYASRKC